jgi:transcriptional regulator with XRE-family HTH domain
MSTLTLQQQLGLAIRARRERLKISQEGFADQIGMHRAYYGAIERGHKNLTLRVIERVAEGLGVAPAALFTDAARLG